MIKELAITGNDVPRRVYIKAYGCQMNVYDAARMADLLVPLGFSSAETPQDADLIILNTCHIREKAAEKVYSELGNIRRMKAARAELGGRMIVAVAGCVAQAEGAEILRRAPYVDLVFGPQSYHRLPELLARALITGGIVDTSFPAEPKFDFLPETAAPQGVVAFLTVQEGCDKFCSFCVVPYTRGREYSRPAMEVMAEARRLVRDGAREITFLGQNVNAYRGQGPDGRDWGLGELIRRLAELELPGLARIRYTTSHPRDVDDDLVAAHREVPQLMPFLHLPVQSGSDRVLEMMNRRYTVAEYRRVIERLRSARDDLALSTDLIVGYPGETDEDFQDTLDLVTETRFAQAFSFKYSPRPGTPAASAGEQVPEEVKSERLTALQVVLARHQHEFNQACIGRILPVLFAKSGRHEGQLVGRSPYLQSVHVAARTHRIGDIVPVLITGATNNSLSGSPSGAAER